MSSNTSKPDSGERHAHILIFSTRDRIRDILTVGLVQCHYHITQATNSNIASLKANQFVPDLIIVDITENNTNDILMVNRLQNTERTRNTPVLAVVPKNLKDRLEKILFEKSGQKPEAENSCFYLIEYPFHFSNLLKMIQTIFTRHGKTLPQKQTKTGDEESANRRIGEQLFDLAIPVENKMQEIAHLLQKNWIFPYTVVKALDIIGSDTSCCNELAACIKSDLSASAAILKVANTVHYAKRQQRVTDVKEAVVRIGFQQTRNLLACFALIDLTSDSYGQSGFTRREFWLHSLAVACIAHKLCEDCGHRRPELAFVAGLIHDLGKIPLDNNFRQVFPKLLEETTSRIEPFFRIEKLFMNFSHAELGHFLTNQWNFPSSISLAILNHHNPDRILQTTPVVDRIINASVFIANQIAKAMDFGHSCDEIITEIPQQMLRDLNINKGPSDRFITSIIRHLNQMSSYLNIDIKPMALTQPASEQPQEEVIFIFGEHSEFHPLVYALRHNGYVTHVIKQLPAELPPSVRVIISMPEPGIPLDIVLYDDDQKTATDTTTLKIFIMNVEPENERLKGYSDNTMIFVNEHHLDMRFVLHTLDKFFGKIVVPQVTEIQEDQEEEKQ